MQILGKIKYVLIWLISHLPFILTGFTVVMGAMWVYDRPSAWNIVVLMLLELNFCICLHVAVSNVMDKHHQKRVSIAIGGLKDDLDKIFKKAMSDTEEKETIN